MWTRSVPNIRYSPLVVVNGKSVFDYVLSENGVCWEYTTDSGHP